MILTDKAKDNFELWLLKERNQTIIDTDREYDLYYLYKYMLPNDLKRTLIIEWFDSVGITVDVIPILNNHIKWQPNTLCLKEEICTEEFEYFETRAKATNKAIEKANEIYNSL